MFQVERDDNNVTSKREVPEGTEVRWSLDIANRKAAAHTFASRLAEDPEVRTRRNEHHRKRDELIIRCRAAITGDEAHSHELRGHFLGRQVKLGNAWTTQNRLYVLGGHGRSRSVPIDAPLDDFADNDGWHDDTSDGPVLAQVIVNGQPVDAKPAWLIVAPFDFAPEIQSFVTLYDIAHAVALQKHWVTPPARTEWRRDVLPLLRRVREYRWVNGPSIRAETQDRHAAWATPERLSALGEPGNTTSERWRRQLFRHLMPLSTLPGDPVRQTYMPRLYGDEPYTRDGGIEPNAVMPLLEHQYEHMRNWADGNFVTGDGDRKEHLCDAMDRIALEACCGGAFHPGIDAPRIMRNPHIYAEAYRLKHAPGGYTPVPPADSTAAFPGLVAGQVTESLAVPWQADFHDCQQERGNSWWPASRPDDVFSAKFPPSVVIDSLSDFTVRWDYKIRNRVDMVEHWSELGVVRRREAQPNQGAPISQLEERVYNVEVDGSGIKRYYYYGETERRLEESAQRFAHFPKKAPPA